MERTLGLRGVSELPALLVPALAGNNDSLAGHLVAADRASLGVVNVVGWNWGGWSQPQLARARTLNLVVLSGLEALAVPRLASNNGLLGGDLLVAVGAGLNVRDVVGLDLVVLGRLPALAVPRLTAYDGLLGGDLLAAVGAGLNVGDIVGCGAP